MPASRDSLLRLLRLLRLVRALPDPEVGVVEILGVDDFPSARYRLRRSMTMSAVSRATQLDLIFTTSSV